MAGNIWFTSDQHFQHKSIYSFQTYLDWHDKGTKTYVRPEFANSDEGDLYMLDKLADCLKDDDKIYFGGDVAMKLDTLHKLQKLPGTKILILGNHDNFKMNEYKKTFKRIYSYRNVSQYFNRFPGSVVLTHCPCHMETFYPSDNTINIHGHIHEKVVRRDSGFIDNRYINISVELTGYKPLHIDEIEKMIIAGETTYPNRFELGAIFDPNFSPKPNDNIK